MQIVLKKNIDKEFLSEVRQYKIRIHWSEPHHQHQNLAEGRVKDEKELTFKMVNKEGAPENHWYYAVELAEDIFNVKAVEKLGWKKPA